MSYHESTDIRDFVIQIPGTSIAGSQPIANVLHVKEKITKLLGMHREKMMRCPATMANLVNTIAKSKDVPRAFKNKLFPLMPKIKILSQASYYETYGTTFK